MVTGDVAPRQADTVAGACQSRILGRVTPARCRGSVHWINRNAIPGKRRPEVLGCKTEGSDPGNVEIEAEFASSRNVEAGEWNPHFDDPRIEVIDRP